MRRLLGVVGAVAAVVMVGPAPVASAAPAGPGPAAGFYTFSADAQLQGTGRVADIASGFDVWVDSAAAHVTRITGAVQYAVGQLTRYGIDIRFRGVAPASGVPTGPGVIAVTEASSATSTACMRKSSADSGSVTEAVAFPASQDVGIATRINAGEVTFCPSLWSGEQNYVVSVALHELGHAVGLGHFPTEYEGHTQVMNPIVPDVQSYQAGDVNGLRYLVAQTAALRAQSGIVGAVDSWDVSTHGLAVTGWAIVGRTSQFADIAVTRDGASVYRITTNTPRPDVAQHHFLGWPTPGFSGAQAPMARGTHRYCVIASATSSTPVTLGCRLLDYPPASVEITPQRALPPLGRAPIQVWWSSTSARLGVGAAVALVLLGSVALVLRRRRRH